MKQVTARQRLLDHPTISHILRYQKVYLPLTMIILVIIPFIISYNTQNLLLRGGESYYFISQQGTWTPLHSLVQFFPTAYLAIIPLLLTVGSAIFFYRSCTQLQLSAKHTFFFLLFLVLSPTFIFTFTTLSQYSLIIFLFLLGLTLSTAKRYTWHVLSIIPFALICFFDIYTTLLLFMFQAIFIFRKKILEKDQILSAITLAITVILLAVTAFYLHLPWTTGPFHITQTAADLVADFGGLSGMSLFLIILGIIGLTIAWQKKRDIFLYLFITLTLVAYLLDSSTIFPLTIVVAYLASTGFVKLATKKWTLISLKKFVLLLLILGMLFTTITYIERLPEYQPSVEQQEALYWIENNTPSDAVVFSDPDNSYYISTFAHRQVLAAPHQDISLAQEITNTTYIRQLFPLLSENSISYLYITPTMRQNLPKNQGFLFLLKNENFKLVYKHNNYEVWAFSRENLQ